MRVVTSTSAAVRLDEAAQFVRSYPPSTEILIVSASRGAADDFARGLARTAATFGMHRFSFSQLAAKIAVRHLAANGRLPATALAGEALAARAVFDSAFAGRLSYFAPVARLPGFPRAVARTIDDLRQSKVSSKALEKGGPAERDLAVLSSCFAEQCATAAALDRAALFAAATEALGRAAGGSPGVPWPTTPLLLLDVPIESTVERAFLASLRAHAADLFATVPAGDDTTLDAYRALGVSVAAAEEDTDRRSDLGHLRRYVFSAERPGDRRPLGDVEVFSAPGEGRESLEIARRVLEEAQRGVPFDQMAVFLRSPREYVGLLEYAFERARVPAYFDRGTRRPDPSGRAFVALLSCAVEKLSARRFDEYLSLGQVPAITPSLSEFALPADELTQSMLGQQNAENPENPENLETPDDEAAIVAGSLRAPWKWEELIVESAVIGGRDRWRRRLDGLRHDYRTRIEALRTEEPESPRIRRYQRDLRNLEHLRAFALPIVDTLDGWWEERLSWGGWLDRFSALAPRALRTPWRVERILADLRPMAGVGPVSLEEARDVLAERLVLLERDPPPVRYGGVFVGSPHQARGRTFRTVFLPGLAERMFPQRLHEDPLLLDDARRTLGTHLATQDERAKLERLLLRLGVGAATERAFVSYPRLQVADSRARVPSFYLLDVARAIRGSLPHHQALQREAAAMGAADLDWPAPADPSRALDDLEHDLATLRGLLDAPAGHAVKGRARYLLQLNDALRRSLTVRFERSRPAWRPGDGIVSVTDGIRPVIASQRLTARPYSLSALQRFATCPYQFLLSAIFRLEPWDEPEPLQRMDPLTRGSLFHRMQAAFFRALKELQHLPVTPATLGNALTVLDGVIRREAAAEKEELAPAIDRVWDDEVEDMRQDLKAWVTRMAESAGWTPEYFEFSFGLNDQGRDEASLADPVPVGGYLLRGAVDLIERSAEGTLRVTDHKTGKNRTTPNLIIQGGKVLQPVLYGMAVETALGRRVVEGRLWFCTRAGGFAEVPIPLNDHARRAGLEALTIVDRAIELGFLPRAPEEHACRWCDFRPVCGPGVAERVRRKDKAKLADLEALRREP
jgi:ATP-dependent helicase/nuclease subunit B